jgi:hypothetical protein
MARRRPARYPKLFPGLKGLLLALMLISAVLGYFYLLSRATHIQRRTENRAEAAPPP